MTSRRFAPVKRVAARVVDGEAVMLTLDDSMLHKLNPSATLIWKEIEAGHDVERILDSLCAAYSVDRERARGDLETLLGELLDKWIIEELPAREDTGG